MDSDFRIPDGATPTEVLFDRRDSHDAVEGSESLSNYDSKTGRWLCPVNGTYTFSFSLVPEQPREFFVHLRERSSDVVIGDWTLGSRLTTDKAQVITGSFTRSCFQGRSYSILIHSSEAGPMVIRAGSSPNSGQSETRFQVVGVGRK